MFRIAASQAVKYGIIWWGSSHGDSQQEISSTYET